MSILKTNQIQRVDGQPLLNSTGNIIQRVVMATDSSSAKYCASRRGLGKMRHIDVKDLWLQEAVCRGRVKLQKIDGEKNPADLLTKYLSNSEIQRHLDFLHISLVPQPSCSLKKQQSRGSVSG